MVTRFTEIYTIKKSVCTIRDLQASEITPNMVTPLPSWLANGQVVVTHLPTPGYSLELGDKQARFQARTAAFSSQRDTQRNHNVDAIWSNQH